MEILIFSDSHGRAEAMETALARQIKRPDCVFFLGDGLRDVQAVEWGNSPLYTVRGNCDWFFFEDAPQERLVTLGGHRFFATHGHAYGVKSGTGALLSHAAHAGADVVLFGHTHNPLCEILPVGSEVGGIRLTRPMYLFNPGSIGDTSRSFGTLSLMGDQLLFSHGNID